MPPQISDDEGSVSDVSQQENKREVKREGSNVGSEPEEELKVESDEEGNEEQAEDEFVVEKILKHAIDEEGVLRFQVKWEGYDKKSDLTWEPEENLETAQDILNWYLESVGGKEKLMDLYNEKKAEAAEAAEKKQGKKRGRPSAAATPQTNGKKSRKNGHPSSSTPPASLEPYQFKPPSGSWEDDVVTIEAMEGPNAEVIVYLTWKGGYKSQHPLHQVYKRCPQKMLSLHLPAYHTDHLFSDPYFSLLSALNARIKRISAYSYAISTFFYGFSFHFRLPFSGSLHLRASGYLIHAEGDPSLGFGCYSTSGAVCTFSKLASKTSVNE
ncbi:hypothetical protein EYC80_009694 [Monilinia laxa]|uniref:Chromo domain-containing protein n=1 Tax=Monilinia laxa TaxID=61186 RepID=A0A5N6JYV1_MONLA|nr:hypothetical protein EYC80_009694 [Monilinia laxa]